MVAARYKTASEQEAMASAQEALAYILDMVEQLARMAARNGAKDLADDLRLVCAEARRKSRVQSR